MKLIVAFIFVAMVTITWSQKTKVTGYTLD
ncbi:MAG: hypothetical protein ACI8Q1_001604, partial [Parvicella sp.]